MKICVIGASRGLGFALTEKFLQGGHHVWAIVRKPSSLDELCTTYPDQMRVSTLDISDMHSIHAWKQEIEQEQYLPDIVIFNASILREDMSAEGYDMSSAQQIIDVNLLGTLRALDCVLPAMLSHKRGSLIFISSTASLRPSGISAAYAASKAGISMAVRSLRVRYRNSGVRFATVVLGPIATEMWEGKRSFLVPSKEKAAAAIAKFAFSNRTTLYYPAFTTWLLRLTLWLPDSIFSILSTKLLKK